MSFDFTINIDAVLLNARSIIVDKSRPTIIFLHDSLGCVKLWRDFPEQLSAATNCNALIYDRQGYGNSAPFGTNKRGLNYLELEADVLNKIIEQLNLDNVFLFGHSDGGTIALYAAAKYQKTIQGIITEGAHVFVEDVTLNGIRKAVELYKNTNLKEKLTKYHGDKTEMVFKAWTETWLMPEFKSWSMESFLPKINCSSLILQGNDDEYGTEAQVDSIINNSSGNSIKLIIQNCGHSPHKESFDIAFEKSIQFVTTLTNL